MKNREYDVIVVGAGAAGLVAAARAAEQGARVLLLEKMERAGRKLLITGKGRCNITNEAYASEFFKEIHPPGKYLKHAFSGFFNKEIVELLTRFGVPTVTERGGRIFPASDKASDVVNALLTWAKQTGVDVLYKTRVIELLIDDQKISGVKTEHQGKQESINGKAVIICTGGKSYPATGSSGDGYLLAQQAGHYIIPARPSLVPLETAGTIHEQLQGLSLKNTNASIWIDGKKQKEEFGELLFTHFGLSGPIILTLSRFVVDELQQNRKIEIALDLKPALDDQKLDARLQRDLTEHGKKQIENIFKLWLPSKLIPVFLSQTGIDPQKSIRELMKDFRFNVTGARSFKEAIITAGGVTTSEVNGKTMESNLIKGLFFAGEVLDLDANTGGYNLQIAWSTGWLAGQTAAANYSGITL